MGSVVLDAVNSFFSHPSHALPHALHSSPTHPQHSAYRETPRSTTTPNPHTPPSPPAKGTRSPSQPAEAHMSEEAQRAPSSSTTACPPPTCNARPDERTRATQQRTGAPQPPSPSLDPNPAPPSEAPQSVAPSAETPPRPTKIKVRDLEHIQSFAESNMGSFSGERSRSHSRAGGTGDDSPQYEISEMKVEHIIEMVAGLLTKITTTNDRQHEHLHRQPPAVDTPTPMTQQTSSVLAFHGKNVPSITILSYLSRINKYCPTSYEVFLSLLVYFDRMTERVNAGPMQMLREANQHAAHERRTQNSSSSSLRSDAMEGVVASTPSGTQQATPPYSGGMEKPAQVGIPGTPHSRPHQPDFDAQSIPPEPALPIDPYNLSHFFVVDSFNIHRLVIAGVTCASKFFSDIFYTNSRYAKVGGLPLPELNHLELQFLLLNDFRLSIPVSEIEAYGTMLVEFYAREVVAQKKAAEAMQVRSLSESSNESSNTVRAVG